MEWPQTNTTYSHPKNKQMENVSLIIQPDPLLGEESSYTNYEYRIGYMLSVIVEIIPEIILADKMLRSRNKTLDINRFLSDIGDRFNKLGDVAEFYENIIRPLIFTALFAGDIQIRPLTTLMDYASLCAEDYIYCKAENLLLLASSLFISTPDFVKRVYPMAESLPRERIKNKEQLKNFLKIAENNCDNILVFHEYNIMALEHLLMASMLEIFSENKIMKRCTNCKRIFVPFSRTDELYCEYGSPQDPSKTCAEYAKLQKQLDRERNSPSGRLYKSISTMMANRINFAKTAEEEETLRQEHEDFKYQGKKNKKAVGRGEITEQDYIDWLNSYKKRGTRNGQHQAN